MDTIATKGEELLTEFWAKVWNPPYDLDTIDRLCTEDFVIERRHRHRGASRIQGMDQRLHLQNPRTAFGQPRYVQQP